jgi:hypothetical protein
VLYKEREQTISIPSKSANTENENSLVPHVKVGHDPGNVVGWGRRSIKGSEVRRWKLDTQEHVALISLILTARDLSKKSEAKKSGGLAFDTVPA